MQFNSENVSSITGELVSGPVKAWHTRQWFSATEYIAAKNPGGDLLLFSRPVNTNWQVENLTNLLNTQVSASPDGKSIRYFFGFRRLFLAAPDPAGDVHIFYRKPFSTWKKANISIQPGQPVEGAVISWHYGTWIFSRDFLAGVNAQGELLVFGQTWYGVFQAHNVTAETGERVNGTLTTWTTRNGAKKVPHLAGRNDNNELIVFWRTLSGAWDAVNVTSITGRHVSGPVTSWMSRNGPHTVEHLAGPGLNGDLVEFQWSPEHDWRDINVSRESCGTVEGQSAFYPHVEDGEGLQQVVSRTPQRNLLLHWWRHSTRWQMLDVTAAADVRCHDDPSGWKGRSRSSGSPVEYIAFESGDHQLRVVEIEPIPRRMLKAVAEPFGGMRYARRVLDLLVIKWDWDPAEHTAPTDAQIDAWVFGVIDSVNDYFRENSREHFGVRRAGTLGWYASEYPMSWYGSNDPPPEPFANRHHRKYMEAVREAADEFDFSAYDMNGDGELQPRELGILLIVPGAVEDGFTRPISLRQVPQVVSYSKNGIDFTSLAEVYVTTNSTFEVIAHELCHLLLGHGDMYFDWFTHTAAGQYSLMDQHPHGHHLDPFAKLKYGWICPHPVLRTGGYTLTDIEATHQALILMDPNHGFKEYFIVENRSPGTGYDQGMADEGLGIWHIMEDPQDYNSAQAPVNVDAALWNSLIGGNDHRLAIRMVRPFIQSPFGDGRALWDGNDPATGYDLLSSDPNPNHNELRWGDGSPSGFNIRNIGQAGPAMTMDIDVPF